MIKKQDIKVGLEFVLPFREFYDDAEKEEYYNRLIDGNKEWHSHKYYTDTCLAGKKDTVLTVHRPILRVLGITENVNITGKFDVVTVENVNKCNVDAFCRQIDSSFIEEYGQAVMSKKKINGVLYSCIEDFFCDNYPSFKCSQIDNVFCQEISKSNWDQNTIIVGGSRSGNKRNLMNSWYQRNLMNSWYHCKIRNPEYENNVEQSNESANEKTEQVSHPSHYAWLKDLCGVEPLDICRHLDINTGNAIKYLLRKDKVDGNKTKTEKRIEDLRKAVFYIQDEIKLLEHGTD